MRIAIDVRSLAFSGSRRPGIQRWNTNLMKQLRHMDSINEYILLCRPGEAVFFNDFKDNFKVTELKEFGYYTYFDQFYEQLSVNRVLNRMNPDLYVSLYFTVPIYLNCPSISLFDDMIPWIVMNNMGELIPPGHNVGKEMKRFHFWKKRSAEEASGIIAISEHTRDDINRFWNIDKEKILVNYIDIEDCFREVKDAQVLNQFRLKYNLPERFILYVATIEPRKNSLGLVKGYELFREKSDENIALVMVGPRGMGFSKFEKEIRASVYSDDIILINDFVPREELPYFYSCAEVFCFPSFYEGFGLTPLEAMACGCPVITSDRASMPEVAGDAAIYIDPFSTGSISEALTRVTGSSDLRENLTEKGLKRAEFFRKREGADSVLNFLLNSARVKKEQKRDIDIKRYDISPGRNVTVFCTAPETQIADITETLTTEFNADVSLIIQKGRRISQEGVPIFEHLPSGIFRLSGISFRDCKKIRSIEGDTFTILFNNVDGQGYLKLKLFTLILAGSRKVMGYSLDRKFSEISWRSYFTDVMKLLLFPKVYLYNLCRIGIRRLLRKFGWKM